MVSIMKRLLGFCARLFAYVLVVLICVFGPLTVAVSAAEQTLFAASTHILIIRELDLYDRLPALISVALTDGFESNPCEQDPARCAAEEARAESDEGGPPIWLSALDSDSIQSILESILPPVWLQSQVGGLIQNAFRQLDGEDLGQPASLSLGEFKQNLANGAGLEAIRQVIEALPECDLQQQRTLVAELEGEAGFSIPSCRPSDEIITEMEKMLQVQLDGFVSEIPDQIPVDLTSAFNGIGSEGEAGETGPFGNDPLSALIMLRKLIRWSPIVVLLLLLLVALLVVRSKRGLLVWWGLPIFLSGLLGLMFVLIAPMLMNEFFEPTIIEKGASFFSATLFAVGLEYLNALLASVQSKASMMAGLLALLGGILLLGSRLMLQDRDPERLEARGDWSSASGATQAPPAE